MSLEAHALPIASFLGGEFPAPVEKLCRGKGLTYFRVPRRAWGLAPEPAAAGADRLWREAVGDAVPPWVADVGGRLGAGFHELLDSVALERLRAFARSTDVPAPQLLAVPAQQWLVMPVACDGPVRVTVSDALGEFALLSASTLADELDAIRPALGEVRDWDQVGEGELAAEGSDSLFAEKTVWSILRWLMRQSIALRLPVVIQPARLEG